MDPELQAAFDTLRQHVDHRLGDGDRRFDQMDQRFDQMDRRFEQVDQRFDQMDRRFEQVDQRLDQVDRRFEQIDQRFDQVDRRFEQVDQRFDRVEGRLDATAVETRRHFDVVAEGLRGEIRVLAEGFTRVDRIESSLRAEIVRSHDELATLMRLGYTDLDRRIRVLERRLPDSD